MKCKNMNAEQKVIALANELINQMQKAGHDCRTTTHPDRYASISVDIHGYNTNEAEIVVINLLRNIEVTGKQTVTIKEVL